MLKRLRPRLTYANVVSSLCLFVLLGGGAYAAATINGRDLVNRSVPGTKLKKDTITGAEVKESKLAVVPTAGRANVANSVAAPEGWHEVGAPGQPQYLNSWHSGPTGLPQGYETPAFFKDRAGIVHLRGAAAGGTANTAIFRLPPGYRPAANKISSFAVACIACSNSDPQGGSVTSHTGELNIYGPGAVAGEDGTVAMGDTLVGSGLVNFDGVEFRPGS